MIKKNTLFISLFSVFLGLANSQAQDTLLAEDFSDMALPQGWSNINNLDGQSGDVWAFDNPGGKGGATGITTTSGANGFAIYDSDHYGADASPHDADLISPSVNFNAYDSVATLSFSHYFNSTGDDSSPFPATGQVGKVMINNGSGWEQIAIYEAPANSLNGEVITIDISAQALGKANVQVKFNWTSGYEQYWAVDDVILTAQKTADAPPPAAPPVAMNDSTKTDTSQSADIYVLENDSVKDHPLDTSSIELVAAPKFGNATINDSLGFINYSPLAGFEGLDSLSYLVKDTAGNPSNEAWVFITIEAPEDTSATAINTVFGEKFNVFPNPAVNQLNLDLDLNGSSQAFAEVFDATGKSVMRKSLGLNTNLDISNLTHGVYLIKVQTNQATYLSRFVKK